MKSSLASSVLGSALFPRRSEGGREKTVQKRLERLLYHAYDHSPFYRELYSQAGIKRENIPELKLADLPIVTKNQILENIEDVYTDRTIKQDELERWMAGSKDYKELYHNKYLVCHTSGSSGKLFSVLYHPWVLRLHALVVLQRISARGPFMLRRKRYAYFAVIEGRFAGRLFSEILPAWFYNKKFISVLWSKERVLRELNAYRPDHVSGYASTLHQLAKWKKEGVLDINPSVMGGGGDPMFDYIFDDIHEAFGIDPGSYYVTTEGLLVGAKLHKDRPMEFHRDLNLIEVVDEKGNSVHEVGVKGKVVDTNLFSFATPIIRYQMDDYVITNQKPTTYGHESVEKIIGRSLKPLPITSDAGTSDEIHPIVLVEFFVPGIKSFQFLSKANDEVEILYTAESDLDASVREEFGRILQEKESVQGTRVVVTRVDCIEPEEKTGKTPVIKFA